MTAEYDVDEAQMPGANEAVLTLARRIRGVRATSALLASDGLGVLLPPMSGVRDHIEDPESAPASLVVFGAYGTRLDARGVAPSA